TELSLLFASRNWWVAPTNASEHDADVFRSPGSGYCSNTERRGDHRASLGSTGHTDHCPVTGAARPVARGRVGRVGTLRRGRPGAGLGEARLCRNCRVPSNRAADWVANLQIHSSRVAGGQRRALRADCDIHLDPRPCTGTWGALTLTISNGGAVPEGVRF